MITREKAQQIRVMMVKAAASLDDSDALTAIEMFAPWASDTAYTANARIRYNGKLWRVRQAHTSQAQYPPSIDTAALYEEVVADAEAGTKDNPIPYSGNMALEKGKYYSQDGVEYLCTRNTGNPVYADLKDLVGHYVEVVV